MPASPNARARVRAQLTEEIKAAARLELGVSGSSGLALRAVARRLEMVPSALYRYFDSREALLTALIIDAYAGLAADAATADRGAGRAPLGRWLAVGHAVRDWAWAHPHEWALVYGTPVPGYRAPQDTIDPALEVVRILAGILQSLHDDIGPVHLPVAPAIGADLERWLALVREPYFVGLSDEVTALAVVAYTHLLGAVSIELFGQFGPDATPAREIFDVGLRVNAALLGLPAAA